MPKTKFEECTMAMRILKARNYKMQMNCLDFPHLKAQARRERIDSLERIINANLEQRVMSMDELMESLNRGKS